MSKQNNQAGKGDKPRNCFSKQFKENYENINWGKNKKDNGTIDTKKTFKNFSEK